MSANVKINNDLPEEEIYKQVLHNLEYIVDPNDPLISNLANFTAFLNQTFKKISWVGFYFLQEDRLWLGPFQGKLACVSIKAGEGVCGTSVSRKETVVVKDVDAFPGHIACDSDSKSEIVVPLILDGKAWGVLDIDSYEPAAFNDTDKKYLEMMIRLISEKLDFAEKLI